MYVCMYKNTHTHTHMNMHTKHTHSCKIHNTHTQTHTRTHSLYATFKVQESLHKSVFMRAIVHYTVCTLCLCRQQDDAAVLNCASAVCLALPENAVFSFAATIIPFPQNYIVKWKMKIFSHMLHNGQSLCIKFES